MKLINNILELIGSTFIIAIALLITLYTQLELIYELGIIGVGTVLAIAMYILSTRYEKRLESELNTKEMQKRMLNSKILELETERDNIELAYKHLEIDLDNEIKERNEWKNKFKQFSNAYDELFSEATHYIGQWVKVEYGQQVKIGQITRILDEKPIKYRVAKCGSKKYLPSDFMEFSEDEIQRYLV